MRCVRVIRAVGAAVISLVGAIGMADADPLLDSASLIDLGRSNGAPTSLYFTGLDLWRKGGSGYGGIVWSPGGLDADGFTLKALLAGGDYLYTSGTTGVRGTDVVASILPGYRIKRGDLEIKIFAGLDLQHHWTLPDDPTNALRGTHAGARANLDLWWEPLPARMMVAVSLTGSTIGDNYGVRGAMGWRLADSFWTGPEIETSGDRDYHQYRAGAHVTSLVFNGFEWAFGAGYVQDNDNRSGAYGRLSLLTRR